MSEFEQIARIILRMHRYIKDTDGQFCADCPIYKYCRETILFDNIHKTNEIKGICLEWDAEHPVKTNRMVLDEFFPNRTKNIECMIDFTGKRPKDGCNMSIAAEEWQLIWDKTINKSDLLSYGWDANPWVWVINFEVVKRPADFNSSTRHTRKGR